jgi:hypothetical protein
MRTLPSINRFDFFIIFDYGLPNFKKIINIIRNDENFDIILIKKFNSINLILNKYNHTNLLGQIINEQTDINKTKAKLLEKFIYDLYSCDTVPLEHLKGKIQYLLKQSGDFIFVLVNNKIPDEKMYGDGEFKHIQCSKIKEIKEIIRNKFNPRKEDLSGRNEEHVIHGSDYESQTEFILKYLNLPNIEYFKRVPNPEFNLRYHVKPFGKYEIIDTSFDKILCKNSNNEFTHISESLYYKYLIGDKEPYINYINKKLGISDFDDHFDENFDKLLNNFNYEKENYIITEKNGEYYNISDGNHRAAILYFKGLSSIPIVNVNIPKSNKIDFSWFFDNISIKYVILRKKEWFPEYYQNEDLDILTNEPDKLVLHIYQLSKHNNIEIRINKIDNHVHLDFYFENNILDFRFDIITSFKNDILFIKDEYTNIVLSRSKMVNINGLNISVPGKTDEVITRLFEYLINPQKTYHLKYVKARLNDTILEEISKYSKVKKEDIK